MMQRRIRRLREIRVVRLDRGEEVEIRVLNDVIKIDEACDAGPVRHEPAKPILIGPLRMWAIVTGAAMGTALMFWERVRDFAQALLQ